jgi:hypothetical protein
MRVSILDLMRCSHHVLDYEKKGMKITWLRCKICGHIFGWLEDDIQKIEGKVVRMSYSEKIRLR